MEEYFQGLFDYNDDTWTTLNVTECNNLDSCEMDEDKRYTKDELKELKTTLGNQLIRFEKCFNATKKRIERRKNKIVDHAKKMKKKKKKLQSDYDKKLKELRLAYRIWSDYQFNPRMKGTPEYEKAYQKYMKKRKEKGEIVSDMERFEEEKKEFANHTIGHDELIGQLKNIGYAKQECENLLSSVEQRLNLLQKKQICTICMEEIEFDDNVIGSKNCPHIFHEYCINSHIDRQVGLRRNTNKTAKCPNCRKTFIKKNV